MSRDDSSFRREQYYRPSVRVSPPKTIHFYPHEPTTVSEEEELAYDNGRVPEIPDIMYRRRMRFLEEMTSTCSTELEERRNLKRLCPDEGSRKIPATQETYYETRAVSISSSLTYTY